MMVKAYMIVQLLCIILIEVEIFSEKNWWQKPGNEVMETMINRFETYV